MQYRIVFRVMDLTMKAFGFRLKYEYQDFLLRVMEDIGWFKAVLWDGEASEKNGAVPYHARVRQLQEGVPCLIQLTIFISSLGPGENCYGGSCFS